MSDTEAHKLIEELLHDPSDFDKRGRAVELLECYFNGFPVASLEALLSNDSVLVKKSAIWIASELTNPPTELVDAIIPLLEEKNVHVRYCALEAIARIWFTGRADLLQYVTSALEDSDPAIRELGMFLISNAEKIDLTTKGEPMEQVKLLGLELIADLDQPLRQYAETISNTQNDVLLRYWAIFLRRNIKYLGELSESLIRQTEDSSIKNLFEEFCDK